MTEQPILQEVIDAIREEGDETRRHDRMIVGRLTDILVTDELDKEENRREHVARMERQNDLLASIDKSIKRMAVGNMDGGGLLGGLAEFNLAEMSLLGRSGMLGNQNMMPGMMYYGRNQALPAPAAGADEKRKTHTGGGRGGGRGRTGLLVAILGATALSTAFYKLSDQFDAFDIDPTVKALASTVAGMAAFAAATKLATSGMSGIGSLYNRMKGGFGGNRDIPTGSGANPANASGSGRSKWVWPQWAKNVGRLGKTVLKFIPGIGWVLVGAEVAMAIDRAADKAKAYRELTAIADDDVKMKNYLREINAPFDDVGKAEDTIATEKIGYSTGGWERLFDARRDNEISESEMALNRKIGERTEGAARALNARAEQHRKLLIRNALADNEEYSEQITAFGSGFPFIGADPEMARKHAEVIERKRSAAEKNVKHARLDSIIPYNALYEYGVRRNTSMADNLNQVLGMHRDYDIIAGKDTAYKEKANLITSADIGDYISGIISPVDIRDIQYRDRMPGSGQTPSTGYSRSFDIPAGIDEDIKDVNRALMQREKQRTSLISSRLMEEEMKPMTEAIGDILRMRSIWNRRDHDIIADKDTAYKKKANLITSVLDRVAGASADIGDYISGIISPVDIRDIQYRDRMPGSGQTPSTGYSRSFDIPAGSRLTDTGTFRNRDFLHRSRVVVEPVADHDMRNITLLNTVHQLETSNMELRGRLKSSPTVAPTNITKGGDTLVNNRNTSSNVTIVSPVMKSPDGFFGGMGGF